MSGRQAITQILKTRRLLPGDQAPPLKLSIALNRDTLPSVEFDRPTVIILWNAACGACLPSIQEVATLCSRFDAACYGVAVMVRNVEATRDLARSREIDCVLAVEGRVDQHSILSRGQVARDRMEASGQSAVPVAFLVNRGGAIEWIGHPDEISAPLTAMLRGDLDTGTEISRLSTVVSDNDVLGLRLTRELMDATASGDRAAAKALIDSADQECPSANSYADFAFSKLSVLAEDPEHAAAAALYYAS